MGRVRGTGHDVQDSPVMTPSRDHGGCDDISCPPWCVTSSGHLHHHLQHCVDLWHQGPEVIVATQRIDESRIPIEMRVRLDQREQVGARGRSRHPVRVACGRYSLSSDQARELACLVGAQAVPTTSDADRVPGTSSRANLLSLIEPNTHLDRNPAFVDALGRHDDLWPLVPEVNTVLQMVVEVPTACDAPRRARLVITPAVVLRGSHDRTVLNVVPSSSNSSHMADGGTESDPSAVSLPSPDANVDKRRQTWYGEA